MTNPDQTPTTSRVTLTLTLRLNVTDGRDPIAALDDVLTNLNRSAREIEARREGIARVRIDGDLDCADVAHD